MSGLSPETIKTRFLASYGVALFLLVAVSLGAHLYINATLADEREAAEMVNMSGAQRMLSQRALALSQALSEEDGRTDERIERLVVTLNRFEAAHAQLRDYALSHRMSPQLTAAFQERFTGVRGLDGLVSEFVGLAEAASDRPLTRVELDRLETLAFGALFEGLDDAVSLFQADAESGLETIAAAHTIQLIVIILVLVGEALFIFWPLTRRLVAAITVEISARRKAEEALRLEASMDASKQRFVAMIREDYLDPLERMAGNIADMEASDRASWPGALTEIKTEIDRTRQRMISMIEFYDDWKARFGAAPEPDENPVEGRDGVLDGEHRSREYG